MTEHTGNVHITYSPPGDERAGPYSKSGLGVTVGDKTLGSVYKVVDRSVEPSNTISQHTFRDQHEADLSDTLVATEATVKRTIGRTNAAKMVSVLTLLSYESLNWK